jgi:hypothetical protein
MTEESCPGLRPLNLKQGCLTWSKCIGLGPGHTSSPRSPQVKVPVEGHSRSNLQVKVEEPRPSSPPGTCGFPDEALRARQRCKPTPCFADADDEIIGPLHPLPILGVPHAKRAETLKGKLGRLFRDKKRIAPQARIDHLPMQLSSLDKWAQFLLAFPLHHLSHSPSDPQSPSASQVPPPPSFLRLFLFEPSPPLAPRPLCLRLPTLYSRRPRRTGQEQIGRAP